MNLREMRRLGILDRMLRKIRTIRELRLADQDILNYACAGKVKILDSRWNFTNILDWPASKWRRLRRLAPATMESIGENVGREVKYVHFCPEKPWSGMYPGSFEPAFWEVARRTPFFPELRGPFLASLRLSLLCRRFFVALFQSYSFGLSVALAPFRGRRKCKYQYKRLGFILRREALWKKMRQVLHNGPSSLDPADGD